MIRHLHGVESRHIESVPIKAVFKGKLLWEGAVEVFELIGHPTATRLYGWAHVTDDPARPVRHVTILHSHPITSPEMAVRAFILQESRNLASENEA